MVESGNENVCVKRDANEKCKSTRVEKKEKREELL